MWLCHNGFDVVSKAPGLVPDARPGDVPNVSCYERAGLKITHHSSRSNSGVAQHNTLGQQHSKEFVNV